MAPIAKTQAGASEVARRIIAALDDPRWEWRTVDGISRETKIPPQEIRTFLNRSGRKVMKSVARDRQGRALYTTRRRYRERPVAERLFDHYRRTVM